MDIQMDISRAPDASRAGRVSPTYATSSHVSLDPTQMAASRYVGYFPNGAELASYKVLRTQLLHGLRERNRNVVMITSARPQEGKTTTAINLALTMAREFSQTVLLIDADLRRQTIHRYLGYASPLGLFDHLIKGVPISDLIVWPGIDKLTIISGGDGYPQASSELLGSPSMRTFVQEVKERYADRLVIFDLPATLDSDDAITFAPLADSIVFVVEAHRTPLPEVCAAIGMLPENKMTGLVLNKFT